MCIAGRRKICTLEKTDPNSSLLHVLVQQKYVVMILSILDTNMYDYCVYYWLIIEGGDCKAHRDSLFQGMGGYIWPIPITISAQV